MNENDVKAEVCGASAAMVLRDVAFGYDRGRLVVDGVTGEVAAGRVTVLMGPNGAGKSTLLRLMLGQLSPVRGQCVIAGTAVDAMDAAKRAAQVSYVPQHSTAAFAFTVRQVVAMGRYVLPANLQAVEHALAVCDLTELANRVYSELSAGQQQRVLLARAVAQSAGEGRVMLLDEPVSSMDLRHMDATMRLLVSLSRQGLAVVAVMHDLNLAARWADEVWVLHEGRLRTRGSVAEVMRPEVLEPVYGVPLRDVAGGGERPMLVVSDA